MKIALCDDDEKELSNIRSLLDSYQKTHNIPFTYQEYHRYPFVHPQPEEDDRKGYGR